ASQILVNPYEIAQFATEGLLCRRFPPYHGSRTFPSYATPGQQNARDGEALPRPNRYSPSVPNNPTVTWPRALRRGDGPAGDTRPGRPGWGAKCPGAGRRDRGPGRGSAPLWARGAAAPGT